MAAKIGNTCLWKDGRKGQNSNSRAIFFNYGEFERTILMGYCDSELQRTWQYGRINWEFIISDQNDNFDIPPARVSGAMREKAIRGQVIPQPLAEVVWPPKPDFFISGVRTVRIKVITTANLWFSITLGLTKVQSKQLQYQSITGNSNMAAKQVIVTMAASPRRR